MGQVDKSVVVVTSASSDEEFAPLHEVRRRRNTTKRTTTKKKKQPSPKLPHRRVIPHRVFHVCHDYVDHYNDEMETMAGNPRIGGSSTTAFPNKLHEMLFTAEKEGFEDVVSWQEHGRAFRVHDRDRFMIEIMPRYVRDAI